MFLFLPVGDWGQDMRGYNLEQSPHTWGIIDSGFAHNIWGILYHCQTLILGWDAIVHLFVKPLYRFSAANWYELEPKIGPKWCKLMWKIAQLVQISAENHQKFSWNDTIRPRVWNGSTVIERKWSQQRREPSQHFKVMALRAITQLRPNSWK